MGKRILLCLSHSIEEHDQLRLLHSLGYEVASIGGYIDPAHPHDDKRPPLPHIPVVPEVKAAVDALGTPDNLGHAQSAIPRPVLDWLGDDGIIIYHHFLERLFGQWHTIRDWLSGSPTRRVIWRSVGQTDPSLERTAGYFRHQGLERVAYSPKEANIPHSSGWDALIRFYADPDEWSGWTGEDRHIINITQRMFQRGDACSPGFWAAATAGLPATPLGEGTEVGVMPLPEMRRQLRAARAYLYTGTRPASYTLGLIEALMTGVPVVSIGPGYWGRGIAWLPDVFEGHELALAWSDEPAVARGRLRALLDDDALAGEWSATQRAAAIRLFGMETVARDWRGFLG